MVRPIIRKAKPMANKNKSTSKSQAITSSKTIEDANKIANGIKKPGQTKEQTKLVSQGIIKGIETYKKQQKGKARELDKQLKKAKQTLVGSEPSDIPEVPVNAPRFQLTPWILLAASWVGFIGYILIER